MDRGDEISGFARKLSDPMSRPHQEMRDVGPELVDWLRAFSDYSNYFEATVPVDFSLLPNEVIYDVVDFHGVQKTSTYSKLAKLVQIEGSWGDFAREYSACTKQVSYYFASPVSFRSRVYDPAEGATREKIIPFEEARNRDICESFIDDDFDLDRLTAVAPKLYDVIFFNELPKTHCKALDLMGTRFSTITWREGDAKKPATPELVNFLRRQLQSNYLRELEVSGVEFEDGAFDKELVVFVTRPWFERLDMGDVLCRVSYDIMEGALSAWKAAKLALKTRKIDAFFSKECFEKLNELLKTISKTNFRVREFGKETSSRQFRIHHPELSTAGVRLTVDDRIDQYKMEMLISDM